MTVAQRQKYTNAKLKVQDDITRKLDSAGRNGRGELLRNSLAILTHLHCPGDVQKVRGDDGIELFFESLFYDSIPDYQVDSPDAYIPVHEAYSSEIQTLFNGSMLRRDWRAVAHMFWNQCVVSTKSSEVRYSGMNLFENYLASAAQEKIETGDIDGALELYEKLAVEAAQSWSKHVGYWEDILQISAMKCNFDFAAKVAESIVVRNPTSRQAWSFLLDVYEERRDVQEGLERLKSAVEEGHVASLRELGRAHMLMGDTIHALETLESAINIDPSNASLYWTDIGKIYDDLHDHDNAIHAYETAVALPHEPRFGVHSLLGDCYRGQGRFKDAIMQYELAIEGRFNEELLRSLTNIYIETGDYDNAIKRLISAIVTYPELPLLKSLLGEVFMEIADYDSAIVAFETAIEDGGEEEVHLWKLIGHAKEHKNDLRGAIDAYTMAVEIDPDDEECRKSLDKLEETMRDQVVEEKGE